MEIRRISFFGGPHSGKSTIAAKLFGELKELGYDVENVQECIKERTYTKQMPESFDQVYLLGEQIRREDILLRNGVPLIVTDSPPLITSFYADHCKYKFAQSIVDISKCFDEEYLSLNIFLDLERNKETYNEEGRFHTFDEAKAIDGAMLEFIIDNCKNKVFILQREYEEIKNFVLEKLNG